MTLNAWNGLPDPSAPANLREGEPYNDPKFEELARSYGIWGTAQSALCAQFWQAARRAPVVPQDIAKLRAQLEAEWVHLNAMQDACKAMLAAAPQPPDADHIADTGKMVAAQVGCACGDSYRTDSFGAGFIAATGKCPNCDASEAAPVQLPEPIAYLHECGKKPSLRTLEFSKVAIHLSAKGYKSHPLYTEQQVRQLLLKAQTR